MSVRWRVPAPPSFDPVQLRAEIEAVYGEVLGAERDGNDLLVTLGPTVEANGLADLVAAHRPDEVTQLDQLVAKARRVWRGEDTFTQAQAQKILAGLVLLENRRR